MTGDPRGSTPTAWLPRLGFSDRDAAARRLRELGLGPDDEVTLAVSDAADPDLALAGVSRLVDAANDRAELLAALRASEGFRTRLVSVLGASAALGEHLARHPADWRVLLDDAVTAVRPSAFGLQRALLDAVGAAGPDAPAADSGPVAMDALRVAYRRQLLTLAARDLCGSLAVEDVAGELADLAAAALTAALAVARAGLPDDAEPCRLAVIGMGKCGGRELNYVSDVDVVFVGEPAAPGGDEQRALQTATQLAAGMMRACSETTAEGALWPVDASLRPEGRAGPLVRTLASHEAYYRRWAKTWEFQALLKARPVAGDLALGERYLELVAPMVWTAAGREGFVDDVREMRRRVEAQLRRADADRELKLGPGGLRDVEFAVQLLQLVHGRGDDRLRSPTTLVALGALARHGYVGRADAAELADAYRFLRSTEHRLQLQRLRRTHLLPADPGELRWVARALGYRTDPVAELTAEHRHRAREVRRLHEKLFYRPLLSAVARLPAEDASLSPEAAGQRLRALGFADPDAALRHIAALTSGVSRRAAIQRTLLPAMLGWFADAPDPDGGLLSFRQLSDALGRTPWYLRLLRDGGAAAERLSRLLGTSRFLADLLGRAPDAVAMLASDDELVPRGADTLRTEMATAVSRQDRTEAAIGAVRGLRRRELIRVAAADLLGRLDPVAVGEALSDVADATLAAALSAAARSVGGDGVDLAVIGMGRLGGREQGYGSDADVLFVFRMAGPGGAREEQLATEHAHAVAEELRRLLVLPAPDPPLVVDAGLRPEGRQGPLVRSLGAYAEYYRRWSSVWEMQALLRARWVAGSRELGAAFEELIAPIRWPAALTDAEVREIRRVKARVEAERLPRGADPALHFKLGRGGLADVEWTAQLLQLRHAHSVPSLRVTGTLPVLEVARDAGLLDEAAATSLASAWRLATRIRNTITLVRGRAADSLPTDPRSANAVARALGYPDGQALEEIYRRESRRARAVVERVFYDS